MAHVPLPLDPGRLSAHVGFLFTEHALVDRFAAAARAGFRVVEHPSPYGIPAAQLKVLLSDAGLRFVQTAFPAGDPARGEKGFAALPGSVKRFRDCVEPTLDYLQEVGCILVHAMAAVRPAGVPHDVVWATYLENLAFAADAAAKRGMRVLIEPIGPGSIANYVVDATALALSAIKSVGRPNVTLLMDAFHAVSLGEDPVATIRDHSTLIAHIQIADYPGRHEPGSGTIDFGPIFAALDDVGYRGYVGCEYHPAASTEAGLGWMPHGGSAQGQAEAARP